MHQNLKLVLLIIFFNALQGCTIPVANIGKGEVLDMTENNTVIFKVDVDGIEKTNLLIEEFNRKGDVIVSHHFSGDTQKFVSSGNEGYYVLSFPKLSNKKVYAIAMLYLTKNEQSEWVRAYGCASRKMFALESHEPGLYYLGDLSFKRKPTGVSYKINSNIKKARNYLMKNHDVTLSSKLTESKIKIYDIEPCPRPVHVIYI